MPSREASTPVARVAVLVALVAAAFFAGWAATLDVGDARWRGFDWERYEAMRAAVPHLAVVSRPEAFRVLGPWLAHVGSFRVLTPLALGVVTGLLVAFLEGFGVSRVAALLCAAAFALTRSTLLLAWDVYQLDDALGLAAATAALLLLRSRRPLVFAIVLAVGVLARESVLAVVPAVAFGRRRWLPWCVPALAVFVAVRLTVPFQGGLGLLDAFLAHAARKLRPEAVLRALSTFAPALVATLSDLRRATLSRPEHRAYLASVVLASLFGTDIERLIWPAAPVVFLAIAACVEQWTAVSRAIFRGACLVGSLHHELTRLRTPSKPVTVILLLLSTLAVALVALRERGRRLHGTLAP